MRRTRGASRRGARGLQALAAGVFRRVWRFDDRRIYDRAASDLLAFSFKHGLHFIKDGFLKIVLIQKSAEFAERCCIRHLLTPVKIQAENLFVSQLP